MNYTNNQKILQQFYHELGIGDHFSKDNRYLKKAFAEKHQLWETNFEQIKEVKYLMIAEAPLWGKHKKYVYNPDTNNTQFFYRSDLETTLDVTIRNKKEFIDTCNQAGIILLDISPFPLNTIDTCINYGAHAESSKKLTTKQYRSLVSQTMGAYFEPLIRRIAEKRHPDIKVFFRYMRVKHTFIDLISTVLLEHGLIRKIDDIGDVAQSGGGIDRNKLRTILSC